MTTILDSVEEFLARFVSHPSEACRVAHTLWIAHTHLMDEWESTPRLFFESPEPGSGKTRALEVTEHLVPRPVHAVNVTPSYLFRKVSDPGGAPTILYDEIDTVFGPKAKDNEDVRGMLNAGHRRGATAGRCVVRGKVVETEELPAYCAVALAGLNDVPDTIRSRSIVIHMRRRAPGEKVEPWRARLNRPEAEAIGHDLGMWAEASQSLIRWPDIPAGIEDRDADLWEPLLAVADLVGGWWPERARRAAISLVSQSQENAPTIGVLLLRDLRGIFGSQHKLPTEDILSALHAMEDAPWANMRGKPVDSRWLSRQLLKYAVKPKVMRVGTGTVRGYEAADLLDPWERYAYDAVVTSSGSVVTSSPADFTPSVSLVTSVTHLSDGQEPLVTPDTEASWKLRDTPTTDNDGATAPAQPHKGVTNETAETCEKCGSPARPGRATCNACLDALRRAS